MKESEFKEILDREKNTNDFKTHFKDIEALLVDLVNYGSNLIPRCYNSSSKELKDAIIIGVLLKHAVSMLDGSQILVSNASIRAAKLQAMSWPRFSEQMDRWQLGS